MYHDSAFNQATSSASIVAVMTSLDSQNVLTTRRSYARPSFASRSLSQIPLFQDGFKIAQSDAASLTTKEEMMALLRSRSRSTTLSSGKSSTSSSDSHHGHSTMPTTTLSTPPYKTAVKAHSPMPSEDASIDASFASTSTLSPRTRRKLLRSARKVGYLLGETPVLCTSFESPPCPSRKTLETTELGILPSSSPSLSSKGSNVKRKNSMNTQTRLGPKAEMGLGMYDGLACAFVAPHQYTELSIDHAPTPYVPTLSRAPPMLKVDCAFVAGTSKRGRFTEGTPEADAQSFVSTTTTTTVASDLFSPTTSRCSPMSPTEERFASVERSREKMHEARRSKVSKLSRHLGEHIPSELVFSLETEQAESYVLVSYESASPVSPLADKTPENNVKVIEPPTRSSSLRRRQRKSLQLDVEGNPSISGSTPSSSPSDAVNLVGAAPSRYKPARALSRSHSVRSRTRKQTSAPASRSSMDIEPENTRAHAASAPAIQTVYETSDEVDVFDKQDKGRENASVSELERGREPRTPLSDAQKALNVRRAQKMLSVFGEAPPNTLLPVQLKCESPVAFNRVTFGGARSKRHSISSVITSASSFMDAREPATFDSPVTPITPRPRAVNGEVDVTPTHTPTSKDKSKSPTPVTPRRRASLSVLPDTPPPFAQYFDPPTLLSIPPVSPAVTRQQQHPPHDHQLTETPKRRPRSPRATHSPPTSSASSASPPTPGSLGNEDPGAVFRERRMRAAKLAKFFGVGYGDLFPMVDEDVRMSGRSFDSVQSLRPETGESDRAKEKEKKMATRVSVTVQREVDAGRTSFSSSSASLSSHTSAFESPRPEMKKTANPMSMGDGDAGKGCYGGLGFATGFTPSRSATLQRQPGGVVGAGRGLGLGLQFSSSVFSLGRQSRRGGSIDNLSTDANDNATLGRKGSARTGGSKRALTIGGLSRSSCGEFGSSGGGSTNTCDVQCALGRNLKQREMARVRVGEKIADVNEVMGRLRELR